MLELLAIDRWAHWCRYGEITGHSMDKCSFKMARDDVVHGWLGASPDGLVQSPGKSLSQGPTRTPLAPPLLDSIWVLYSASSSYIPLCSNVCVSFCKVSLWLDFELSRYVDNLIALVHNVSMCPESCTLTVKIHSLSYIPFGICQQE